MFSRRALLAPLVASFALAAHEAHAVTAVKKKTVKTAKATHKSPTKVSSRAAIRKLPAQT